MTCKARTWTHVCLTLIQCLESPCRLPFNMYFKGSQRAAGGDPPGNMKWLGGGPEECRSGNNLMGGLKRGVVPWQRGPLCLPCFPSLACRGPLHCGHCVTALRPHLTVTWWRGRSATKPPTIFSWLSFQAGRGRGRAGTDSQS